MNKILLEIKKIMIDCIEKYIPDISFGELEDNGAVFAKGIVGTNCLCIQKNYG